MFIEGRRGGRKDTLSHETHFLRRRGKSIGAFFDRLCKNANKEMKESTRARQRQLERPKRGGRKGWEGEMGACARGDYSVVTSCVFFGPSFGHHHRFSPVYIHPSVLPLIFLIAPRIHLYVSCLSFPIQLLARLYQSPSPVPPPSSSSPSSPKAFPLLLRRRFSLLLPSFRPSFPPSFFLTPFPFILYTTDTQPAHTPRYTLKASLISFTLLFLHPR